MASSHKVPTIISIVLTFSVSRSSQQCDTAAVYRLLNGSFDCRFLLWFDVDDEFILAILPSRCFRWCVCLSDHRVCVCVEASAVNDNDVDDNVDSGEYNYAEEQIQTQTLLLDYVLVQVVVVCVHESKCVRRV